MRYVKLYEYFDVNSDRIDRNEKLEKLLDFISDTKNKYSYLHTTRDENVCKNIMDNGFEFYNFYKTTDHVTSDMSDLIYKMGIRKGYGNYVIVILTADQIPYPEKLSYKEPFYNDSGELVYTLPPKYVKGYYNRETGEIVKNPKFES